MSNEIKVALKAARDTFREKKYIDVIKKCNKILMRDENNYSALMLLAAAMKEIDEYKPQVPLILQKGTKIQADNPLAWYGLVSYYEKNLDNNECYNQLLLAYCKLLEIESDSKFTNIMSRISKLFTQLKDVTTITQCIEHLIELRKNLDDNKIKVIDKTLGWLLLDNFYNLNKYQNLLESVFKSTINDLDATDQQKFYTEYLKILYDKDELIDLVKEAINMHQRFPQDTLPLEYICLAYSERNILDENFTDLDITQFYEGSLKLNKECEAAKIAKALDLAKSGNLIIARDILKDILVSTPRSVYGWMALSQISMKLYCWEDAEVAAKRVLDMKKSKIKNKLLYKMKETLVESTSLTNDKSKWETALRMCEQIHPSARLDLIRARLSILLHQPDVEILLNNLESKDETRTHTNILRALYLKQNKQYDEAVNILDSAVRKPGLAQTSQAWLLLGTIYWEMAEYNYSLMAFLNGIKADRFNWKCLVYLGQYYRDYGNDMERSRRCYQTALQINPNSEEAGIGLSTAYRLLKNQDANIKLLQMLTAQDSGPRWAWLQLGLQYLDQGNAEQAIKAFQHVIRADPSDRVAMLPDKYSHLKASSILIKYENDEHIVLLKRIDMFSLSARCYCCALSLSPESVFLWYDLALCYLMQLQHDPSINHKNHASKCLAAAKHAVKLCPSTWKHWNLLGIICMSPYVRNYALAQHAFVMAIDKELNNAIVWSNLGTLYLYIGNLYKANEAYSRAQRADPSYINSWIGQALIAEIMDRKETVDLFRHARQLGYHSQAAIGYTHWVLVMILNPTTKHDILYMDTTQSMHAISSAADVMTWYVENHPNDCHARNAYGLLLERQRLYKSAAEQFAVAVCNSTKNEKDLVSINLARVLIRLKRYNEAIKLCQGVENINYNSQCNLALALFKAKLYEEAYNTYEKTLQSFANTEAQKSFTLCAMAAIAYSFHRVNDAKTLLFQCIQIHPPVIIGLLAAASLGILHGDINLVSLVLKELEFSVPNPEYGHHILSLYAYYYVMGNDVQRAITILSKEIFRYPGNVKYWTILLRILLDTDLQLFSRCAQKVLFLNRNIITENHAHVACALSYSCFMLNMGPASIRSMQKLLFTYPASIESWAMFITGFLSSLFCDILSTMEEDCQKYANMDINNLITKTGLFSFYMTSMIMSSYLVAAVFYLVGAIAFQGTNDSMSRELLLKMDLPFETSKSPNYELVVTTQFIIHFSAALAFGTFTALLFMMILHLGCQIDIMCQNLTDVFPKNENKLKFFIIRYQEIITFAEKIEKLFTYIALSQLISNTVNTCCEGFLIVVAVNNESGLAIDILIKSILFYIVICLEVFIYCFAGEYLRTKVVVYNIVLFLICTISDTLY
ncbi:tetratricopeptide repeat protein 37 isoform X2 [Bombus vancouverensis nearcticus]|uniref:tetratricopeptide repeat protein 37 isoform X2 n=1 Tax=Bombus vancouverensis nearcticus TaxID=2705178 RepID=UPI00402B853E